MAALAVFTIPAGRCQLAPNIAFPCFIVLQKCSFSAVSVGGEQVCHFSFKSIAFFVWKHEGIYDAAEHQHPAVNNWWALEKGCIIRVKAVGLKTRGKCRPPVTLGRNMNVWQMLFRNTSWLFGKRGTGECPGCLLSSLNPLCRGTRYTSSPPLCLGFVLKSELFPFATVEKKPLLPLPRGR